jgi:hypothetical protein
MVVAVAGAVSMRGEAWCRYACPLGNMAACYSVASTVHVHANPMICQSQCTTHECHKGSENERGCPVFLHPLYVKDSHFCKLCMACVRNCPNDSAKLWIRPPLQDVWSLAELNPQLLPLALTLFLLAPLLLARIDQPLTFTILAAGLLALVIPLRWALVRAVGRDGDPTAAFRVIFALGILAWGPLMAFHLGNVPGLPGMYVHNEVHQAGLVTMSVLPALQIVAILGASLATVVVLGRIRDRTRSGSWWSIYLLVVAYVALSTWLIF